MSDYTIVARFTAPVTQAMDILQNGEYINKDVTYDIAFTIKKDENNIYSLWDDFMISSSNSLKELINESVPNKNKLIFHVPVNDQYEEII